MLLRSHLHAGEPDSSMHFDVVWFSQKVSAKHFLGDQATKRETENTDTLRTSEVGVSYLYHVLVSPCISMNT